MSDVLAWSANADPRCDRSGGRCRINRATGLQCRDCPKRRRAALGKGAAGIGVDISTFLRRALPGDRPSPPSPSSGRCCEE